MQQVDTHQSQLNIFDLRFAQKKAITMSLQNASIYSLATNTRVNNRQIVCIHFLENVLI